MERSSREVRLAKMTSYGLYLSSVVLAPLLIWFGRPRQTHWEKSGLHTFLERSFVAWHICMLTELFTVISKVKMFCWLTMLRSNWVRKFFKVCHIFDELWKETKLLIHHMYVFTKFCLLAKLFGFWTSHLVCFSVASCSILCYNKKAVLSRRWPRDACYISGSSELLRDITIRNYPRWQPATNLDLM